MSQHDGDPARNVAMTLAPRQDSFALIAPAAQLAERISKTEFVPVSLRNRPEAVLAAILTGNEVGLPPMTALSHIHVIEGRPSLDAMSMRALILSNGHELWWPEMTITRCSLCGRRRGSDNVTTVTWTMDDARRAKLEGKAVWRSYPRAMLMARCTGELARAIFADVVAGIPYAREEIEDGFLIDAAPQADGSAAPANGNGNGAESTTKRRARRAATAPPEPPPPPPEPEMTAPAEAAQEPPSEPDAPPPVDTPPPADEQGMTLAQRIAMNCREAGIERADLIRAITGKERGRDCTREEAIEVLEAAKAIARGDKALAEVDGHWQVVDVIDGPPDVEPDQLPLGGSD